MELMLKATPAIVDKVAVGIDYASDAILISSAIGFVIAFWVLLQDA